MLTEERALRDSPLRLLPPPLSLFCTLHPSQHSNLVEVGTSFSLHMHKHTVIPVVQWPILQGRVRPMGALQADYIDCWTLCHGVRTWAELEAAQEQCAFPTFLGNVQRWASGDGRGDGEVDKEESIE